MFDRVVSEARRPHWYVEGEVPDTINGRFAVLATVCALAIVRLESGSKALEAESAALTERFVEAMDAEHRELGLNDPGLGRRVRKLVGSLERRVDSWRETLHDDSGWQGTVVASLYRGDEPKDDALRHSTEVLRDLWARLSHAREERLLEGVY